MTTVDYSRRISSGGAFGYYDGYPTGDLPGTSFTASFASGLHNTWVVSKNLAAGSTVSVIFGQQSANPAVAPTPNLFDVSLSFSGSIAVYGVDVGGLSLTSDALSIDILGNRRSYSGENLSALLTDLLVAGVPQETAENFVATVDAAMGTIAAIETEALRIYNTINTMDLSTMENLVNIDLASGMATSLENGTPVNIGEIAHVTGTGYDDKIKGNASDNIIHGGGGADWISGGSGADALFGGGADDFIFFDAEDGANVYGGDGRDVAVALGQAGVTVNMAAQELECVIGGDGADHFVLNSGQTLMAAGGGGADTFEIHYDGSTDACILWGGDDTSADVFNFVNSGEYSDSFQAGILVVSATGLTAENFSTLDLSMLGLPASFDWGKIDAVIINPGPEDSVLWNGEIIDTSPITEAVYAPVAVDEQLNASADDVIWSGDVAVASEGQSDFLGATLHMQAHDSGYYEMFWYRRYDPPAYTAFIDGMEASNSSIDERLNELTAMYGNATATWTVDMSAYDDNGNGSGVFWYIPAEWDGAPGEYDPWFVAGGAFDGTQLNAIGAPHIDMPENSGPSAFDWLLAA
jgi:hypothetical protein